MYQSALARLEVRSARGDYTVVVGCGLLDRITTAVRGESDLVPGSVATDATVGRLYGRTIADRLELDLVELPSGEPAKRWSAVEMLCRRWLAAGLDRSATVLAIGGGVVTDTVGFAAAVYLRGIDWIAAPTTLLGMVDAAVGGKTGVNLPEGKNLIGAFWPPRLVLADVDTLSTLPVRELRAGLAEVVKTAWIGDHELLSVIDRDRPVEYAALTSETWQDLVARCLAVKARVVEDDERERGARAALNLGHTVGHALEAVTGYRRFLHGEAVAWGMLAAAELSRERGLLSDPSHEALRAAVAHLGPVPPIDDLDVDLIRRHIGHDKKRTGAGIGWVLPTDGGIVIGQHIDTERAIEAVRRLQDDGFPAV
ncbi:MAG: 3-dehydroquinate synthase [Holophagae bacterium]